MPRKPKTEIIGLVKLRWTLRFMPEKVNYKMKISALRSAARIIVRAVRKSVPGSPYMNRTYTLRNSIGVINGKDRYNPYVLAAVRVDKKSKYNGWYGFFIERGTRGVGKRVIRESKTKQKKGLVYSVSGAAGNSGIKATHFFENSAIPALPLAIEDVKRTLANAVVKYLRKNVPKK